MSKEYVDGKMVTMNRRNKHEDWELYEGKHKGIISEEQYWFAQQLFKEATPVKLDLQIVNPLVGLLVCADCGKTVKYVGYKGFRNDNTAPRYSHITSMHCKKKSLPATQVIEALTDALKAYIEDCHWKMKSDSNEAERQRHLEAIAANKAELAKLEKRRDRLFDSYDAGDYTRDEFLERKQKYVRDIDRLKDIIKNLTDSMPEAIDYTERIATLHAMINCINDATIDGKAKNDFLKQYIERITYDVEDYGQNKGGRVILDVILK
jgi:hypothetical protein